MTIIPFINNKITLCFFVLISLLNISCEKVVSIDLNSAAPHIVIEANISDQAGPYYVQLSQTVNFDQTNTFPPVSGAKIILSDNAGNLDSLVETISGTYRTSTIQGVPGRTYTLTVNALGSEYVAVSTMPPPVNIDSLSVQIQAFGRNQTKYINVIFQDSANVKNYYRFIEVRNGVVQKFTFLYDDRLQDGGTITSSLFADEDTLNSGDKVQVFLLCIDKNVFDYFRTIRQASGNGGPQAASPANPISNFSNDALGYFNAFAVRSKLIIIP
jgi:hypothetical protein